MIESSLPGLASADPRAADSLAAGCDDFTASVSRRTAIRSALGIGIGLVAASVFGGYYGVVVARQLRHRLEHGDGKISEDLIHNGLSHPSGSAVRQPSRR